MLGAPAFDPRGLAQTLIKIRVVLFHVVDDLEVFLLHPAEVDALDVDQPQQLAHGLGHGPAAFVARAAALRDADHGPEFLLVHAQTPADFPRVDEFDKLHFGYPDNPQKTVHMPTAWSVPGWPCGMARGGPRP